MGAHRPDYRIVATTADIGFEVTAPGRAELFADALLALEDMMVGWASLEPREARTLDVEGIDDGDRMVALLSRALYLLEVDGMAFCEARAVLVSEDRVVVEARGERFDPERHALELAVKAVTYHELDVGPTEGGWRARIIVDI